MYIRRLLAITLAGTMFSSVAADPSAEALLGASLEASAEATTETSTESSSEASLEVSTEASSGAASEEDIEILPEDDPDIIPSDDSGESSSDTSSDTSSDASSEASSDASSEASSDASSEASSDSGEIKEVYTGYVLDENSVEITHNPKKSELLGDTLLPSSHTTEHLPPLVDQSPYGTCWAFSTTALEEINLLKKGIVSDLSELHMAYFSYNTVVDPLGGTQGDYVITPKTRLLNLGGNYEMAFSINAQWMGAVDESVAKYDRDDGIAMNSGLQDAIAFDDVAHVQGYFLEVVDVFKLRETQNVSLLDPVKKMVYDYGAAGIVFAAANGYMPVTTKDTYNKEHNCFYNPGTANGLHAVAIVGWDDNFPKEYFATEPPGDGAFLIRNSWTTEDADDRESFSGYFWMSYYENTLHTMFYAVDVEPASNYDNNYQYDGGGSANGMSYTEGANVYTAHAEGGVLGEELKAVSFYSTATNVDYTISVYTDVVDTPDSGNLVSYATTTGTTGFAGVTTVPLRNSVSLEPGQKFAVAVQLGSPALRAESSYSGNSAGVSSRPGESYIRTGGVWRDRETMGNFRIKAYTCNKTSSTPVLPTGISFKNVDKEGDKYTLNLRAGEVFKVVPRITPASATDRDITWSSSDETVARVVDGQIEPLTAGEATITASLLNGEISEQIQITVIECLIGMKLRMTQTIHFATGESYWSYEVRPIPSDYVPKGDVVWTSSDEDVVTIDSTGRIDEKMMGNSLITATLEGKTAYVTHTVKPSWDYVDYEVSDDKVVTMKWKAAKNASSYIIFRADENLKTIPDDGSESYEYVDDYYVGKEDTSTVYNFGPIYEGSSGGTYYEFEVALGMNYHVTYHLNGGTQNPANPTTYISGRAYSLKKPTPPAGYNFGGWYTDPSFNFDYYRSSIVKTDTGDLDFYAKYYPTPPELNVTPNPVHISEYGSAEVTAEYKPADGTEQYVWRSFDERIAKVTAEGNRATITACGREGYTSVSVTCKGKEQHIGVFVEKNIWFDEDSVSVRSLEGSTVKLTAHVSDAHSTKAIDWSSSDNSVAMVSNGVVTPVSGIAERKEITITATIRGTEYSASCRVVVLPALLTEAPTGYIDDEYAEQGEHRVYKGSLFKLTSKTNDAKIYYALEGRTPGIDSEGNPQDENTLLYKEALKIDADTVIKAIAFKAGSKVSSPVTYSMTIIDNDWGDITNTYVKNTLFGGNSTNVPKGVWYFFEDEDRSYVPKKYTGSYETDYCTVYSGSKITLSDVINVYHGTRKLIEGREYTLSYKNNTVAAGASSAKAPSVTVKGKGNYSSTATFKFSIRKRPISEAELCSEKEVAVMAGKSVRLTGIKPTLKYAGKTLKAGKDYLVSYYEGEGTVTPIPDPSFVFLSEPGRTYTAEVVAVAGSNFDVPEDDSKNITIRTKDPAKCINASKLKVTDAAGKALKLEYTGQAYDLTEAFDNSGVGKNPKAFVKNGRTVLVYGTDYAIEEVAGNDYRSAGKHKFVIKGKENSDPSLTSYEGQKTDTFEITGIPMSKVKIAGLKTSVEYTGKPITITDLFNPADKKLEEGWNGVTLYYYDSVGKVNKPLILYEDNVPQNPSLEAISGYEQYLTNNGNPGKFTLEFKGIDGVSGSIKKTITIKAYNVKNDTRDRMAIEVEDVLYAKSGAKPKVTVKFVLEGTADDPVEFVTLREGIDYSVSYKNNTKVMDKAAPKGAPTAVVKGIGNFTGSNATRTFTISKAPISSTYLLASDVSYNARGKKGYFFQAPKVYQDEKALTIGKGKDLESFDKTEVEYTYAADTVLGDQSETVRVDGEEVSDTDIIMPGTKIRVSIKCSKLAVGENSSFVHDDSEQETDEIVGYYRVTDPAKSLAKYKAELTDPDKTFFNNGKAIVIRESDISVYRMVNKQKEELDISDYRIKSVRNNRFLGKAAVVIEGVGDYNGTRTLTIKINARKVFSDQE